MKTTDICNNKTNETKAWLRLRFMSSGQGMDQTYSTAHEAHVGLTQCVTE